MSNHLARITLSAETEISHSRKVKIAANFHLWEFLPEETFIELSTPVSISLIDSRIIGISQFVRDRFGKPTTINDWKSGGKYNYSGYRPYDLMHDPRNTRIRFAKNSQHKFGRAVDLKVRGISSEEVQQDIRDNYKELYQPLGLTRMELATVGWTHVDVAYTDLDDLVVFSP